MADRGDGKLPVCYKHTVSANSADDWGVTSAAALPLPNDDMHFGCGAPAVSPAKNNTIFTTREVPTHTPAATPDAGDNWGNASSAPATKTISNNDFGFGGDDFGGLPVAGCDSGFGDDGFGGGASADFGDDEDPFGNLPAGENAMDLTGTLLTEKITYNGRAGGPMGPPRRDPTSIFSLRINS